MIKKNLYMVEIVEKVALNELYMSTMIIWSQLTPHEIMRQSEGKLKVTGVWPLIDLQNHGQAISRAMYVEGLLK